MTAMFHPTPRVESCGQSIAAIFDFFFEILKLKKDRRRRKTEKFDRRFRKLIFFI